MPDKNVHRLGAHDPTGSQSYWMTQLQVAQIIENKQKALIKSLEQLTATLAVEAGDNAANSIAVLDQAIQTAERTQNRIQQMRNRIDCPLEYEFPLQSQ